MKKVDIKSRCIPYRPRSKNYSGASTVSFNSGSGNNSAHGPLDYLPATRNGDGSYTVSVSCVHFLGNVFGEKEITAWKVGNETEEGQGGKIIIDTALSATSENPVQNKVIYAAIGDMSRLSTTAKGSLVDAINEAATKGGSSGVDASALWQLLGGATTEQINKSHLTNALKGYLTSIPQEYVTDTELQDALGKISTHTHTNKAVLDKISEANYQSWVKVVQNWDKAFYFDSKGNIRVRLNLIGEKEVTAWQVGESGTAPTPGLITIVDNLSSTSAEAALSANQGRILKQMIADKQVDLSGYATQQWVLQQDYIKSYTNNYVSAVRGNGNGYLYLDRFGLSTLSLNLSHTHSQYLTEHQSLSHLANKTGSNASGTWSINISGKSANTSKFDGAPSDQFFKCLWGVSNNAKLGNKKQGIANWVDDDWTKGYHEHYGTSIMFCHPDAEWYNRLDFGTGGRIAFYQGINTATMREIGRLAFLTDNVASATKLQTTRSLWGQQFDGTGDVSGGLKTDDGIAVDWSDNMADSTGQLRPWHGLSFNSTITGPERVMLSSFWGMMFRSGGDFIFKGKKSKVGIGTDNPLEKLHVAGNQRIDGNLQVFGNIVATGEITAFASDGSVVSFLYNPGSYADYTSASTTQAASVKAVKFIKDEVERYKTENANLKKAIKAELNKITSTSTITDIRNILIAIGGKL